MLPAKYPALKKGKKQIFKKRLKLPGRLLMISFGVGFWLNNLASPASAQFFRKAEDFFKTTLTQGSSAGENSNLAISLIFNGLRAVFLLYIAVSLIGIINAVRKDEDWQSIARIPLLVIVAVTIADILTGFIIGGN
ncbi:hypothetical protein PCC7424_3182 [Gloeothece citriformis PCC 7424]|uniref:Uncharacterized protein n=1 Tax=Gloeothece citriformis (strain PCC 7424) TaxID=65393 RepID=B7KCN3_GLOC7|nr:hypothetical protein [Gloeothece citriformis]ACK71584.1 hypothetical protein PCC7424_3182 [Gloeothece citriformis PCC 7424]